MCALNLWLIRHGETTVNQGNWTINPNDAHLTEKGLQQAEQSAAQVQTQPDRFIASPLIRAQETLQFFTARWPDTPLEVAPIHEFIYLSPKRFIQLNAAEKKAMINDYWLHNDPNYQEDIETESFSGFLQRVSEFYKHVIQLHGYVVVIGHGQFFKAFQLGIQWGFTPSPEWMQNYKKQETSNPIKNGEIIQLTTT